MIACASGREERARSSRLIRRRRRSCRPAVDMLLRSVNDVYGGAAVAVILTGMGQDGLNGVQALKKNGAYVIAQDEASSVVWGMPGAVARAGVADAVVDLKQVVPQILEAFISVGRPVRLRRAVSPPGLAFGLAMAA